jgi:hypothetical protein
MGTGEGMTDFIAMARRSPLTGTVSHQPTFVADLNGNFDLFLPGQTVYLARPDQIDEPLIEVILRGIDGKLVPTDVAWSMLRNPRIESVPIHIAQYCWRATRSEMEDLLARIIQRHCPRITDFGASFDLATV